jgi:MFS superfamily sulfate permease-like transporter
MIGQTMINVKASGARTRISTFLAGVFLLILVLAFGDVVAIIPMAVLVAVMIVVSVATFDWHSIRPSTLRRMPVSETIVMVLTVAVTVWTHNLAIGVGVGVIAAAVLFARRVASLTRVTREVGADVARYTVEGELFFASSNDLTTKFAYHDDPSRVVIDLSRSHVWDASTVAALDAVRTKYAHVGTTVELVGMSPNSPRYIAANRPRFEKPQRAAIAATVSTDGSALRSSARAASRRTRRRYCMGVRPVAARKAYCSPRGDRRAAWAMSASTTGSAACASTYALARRTGAGSGREGRPAARASVKVVGKARSDASSMRVRACCSMSGVRSGERSSTSRVYSHVRDQ